jgi:hypothetical protein
VLGNAAAWLWFALLVTPGWFAVRGWHLGREEPLPTPLTEWLPLALAISVTWSGIAALTCAARAEAIAAGDPTTIRIAMWLVMAGMLWLVPCGVGWLAGRVSRKRGGQSVTVVLLKNGTTVAGTFHHETKSEFTLANATVESGHYERVTINRGDAELVLRSSDFELGRVTRSEVRGR